MLGVRVTRARALFDCPPRARPRVTPLMETNVKTGGLEERSPRVSVLAWKRRATLDDAVGHLGRFGEDGPLDRVLVFRVDDEQRHSREKGGVAVVVEGLTTKTTSLYLCGTREQFNLGTPAWVKGWLFEVSPAVYSHGQLEKRSAWHNKFKLLAL